MQEAINQIEESLKTELNTVCSRPDFEQLKARYVGAQGNLTTLMQTIRNLPPSERPAAGKLINVAKKNIETILANFLTNIENKEKAERLGPSIDPTLPCVHTAIGAKHPLFLFEEEIKDILKSLGFWIEEGTQIETEWYCFDALNTPDFHPARAAQDTFYFPQDLKVKNVTKKAQERYLLRTQTSNVQIRKMMENPPPLRIASLGRCFRRDTVDATHSANFHQLEGLYVDKHVSLKDLKNTLDYFLKKLFGDIETRLRPSFFPFTEPSYELDVRLKNVGKLSGRWLEILGCGLVDPKVFEAVGYDEKVYSGFAWGMGIERLAMIRYNIDDIRHFYQNDLRFLHQFIR